MAHPLSFDERQTVLDSMEEWRQSLEPAQYPDFLTGLLPRVPDPRDYDLRDIPQVRAMLSVGYPDSYDLQQYFVPPALNQGAVPSCVSHSVAHMKSIQEKIERNEWILYNAPQLHNESGPQNEGRWPDQILKIAKDQGVPRANGAGRDRIASYAFAPKTSTREWADSLKAAIAAKQPCVIAFLLPSTYGWESSGGMTQGYHENCLIGYRPDAFLMLNSWGPSWGRGGLGWVSIDFLCQSNWQNGYTLAHTVTDERTDPQPGPEPSPVTVTAVEPNRVKGGQSFFVMGTGFGGGGILTAQWSGQALAVESRAPTRLSCRAPQVQATTSGPVRVQVEGAVADGPQLTVEAQEQPAPVVVTAKATAKLQGRGVAAMGVGQQIDLRDPSRDFEATLTVTEVIRERPEPEPGPEPEPEPQTLAVKVQVYRYRDGHLFYVQVTGKEKQPADLSLWQGERQVPLQRPARVVVNGPWGAVLQPGLPSGSQVTVRAAAGADRGEKAVVLP